MKNQLLKLLTLLLIGALISCSDSDEPKDKGPDDTGAVSGQFSVLKAGSLTAQSSTNTRGMFQIVEDEDGKFFVRLTDDFTTKFSTGTVTVYLSTSQTLNLDQTASFQLVSIVGKAGEHFFSLPAAPDAKFSHGIIWCGAAAIPFGFAPLN
ncbi:hypothetical protein [Algoriphagus namhaensis]